jgi:type 1 fimbriae regulatory protein FimB
MREEKQLRHLAQTERCFCHVRPHMLRHACGFKLANEGTDFRTMLDFLSDCDPKHTVRYTRIAGARF